MLDLIKVLFIMDFKHRKFIVNAAGKSDLKTRLKVIKDFKCGKSVVIAH